MERIHYDQKDPEYSRLIEHIFEKAQGITRTLDSAPTSANPILQEGERGIYGTKEYRVVGGTLYESTLTQTA